MSNTGNKSSNCLTQAAPTASWPNTSFLTRSSFKVTIPTAIQALISTNETTSSLGKSFQPGEYDVVCGRGRGWYTRSGNKRLREIVGQHIPDYIAARTKLDKSVVLNNVLEQVRQQNNGNALFVKKDKKQGWFEIGDDQAREKVGHVMRDAIASKNKRKQSEKINKNVELEIRHRTNILAEQQPFFSKSMELREREISSFAAASVLL